MSNTLVISIKPKYASLIYDGVKMFEFRKAPPRNLKATYIVYESAPVSKMTGVVTFCASFTCRAVAMVGLIRKVLKADKKFAIRAMGITEKELIEYAGGEDNHVTALLVDSHFRDSKLSEFSITPPQNWGSIRIPGDELVLGFKRLVKRSFK